MNQYIEKIRSKLTEDLNKIKEIENPLEKLIAATRAMDHAVKDLNQLLEKHSFSDELQEVYFFKQAKPEILALKIEEVFRYSLSLNKPIGTDEIQIKYYSEELKALESFFRMNTFHYQYYKNGLTYLDNRYFLRNAEPLPVPLAEIADTGSDAIPMSYLFAKFKAYEAIQYFILEQIAGLKSPLANQQLKLINKDNELKWTGDTINLVELAYGIWLTNQINNGQASMAEITRWLEKNFGVHIGDPNRRWQDIARRKSISPTKYLDLTISEINKRLDNERSLNRQKRRSNKS